jgi:uncharacterized protein YutE (UPF0331/DUF86 family)
MIDPTLVIRKINLISQDLDELLAISRKDLTEYLSSQMDEVLAERYLERMIGRIIDINYHLITETGHPPPADYYQSFTQLGKLGILPSAFAKQMAAFAGLRNRLVHEYDDIDPRKLYEGMQAAVRNIPQYLTLVHQYLQRLPAP